MPNEGIYGIYLNWFCLICDDFRYFSNDILKFPSLSTMKTTLILGSKFIFLEVSLI